MWIFQKFGQQNIERLFWVFFHSRTSSSDKSVLSSPVSRPLGQTLIQENESGTSKLQINRKCLFAIFQGGAVLLPICKIRQNKSQIQLVRYYFEEKTRSFAEYSLISSLSL